MPELLLVDKVETTREQRLLTAEQVEAFMGRRLGDDARKKGSA